MRDGETDREKEGERERAYTYNIADIEPSAQVCPFTNIENSYTLRKTTKTEEAKKRAKKEVRMNLMNDTSKIV